jgi:hypothetical protein
MLRTLRRLWLPLLVVVVLVLAGYAYFRGVELPGLGQRGGGEPVGDASNPTLTFNAGQPVVFGEWEYTITDSRRGADVPGRTARGGFLLVTLRARNNGREPQALKPSDFGLVDGTGRRFSPDEEATKAAAGTRKDDLFAGMVQPGLAAEGQLAFDIPSDLRGLALRLNRGFVDVRLNP